MKILSISVCLISAALSGCVSKTGSIELERATPITLDAVIKKHVTTSDDIRNYLGSPLRVEHTQSGNEIWTYIYRKTDIKARTFIPVANLFLSEIDTSEKILTIVFDRNKKVAQYTVSEYLKRNTGGILEK